MRTGVLVVAFGVFGCAEPQPAELPAVVIAPQPAAAPAPTVAPPPRRIEDDPRRPSRMEWHRSSDDPVLRDLARGHIKGGDEIELLIRLNPHYDVFRFGEYVVMTYNPTGYGGTRLAAKGGRLIYASTSSCIFHDEFIHRMTEPDWTACWGGHGAEMRKRGDTWTVLPAVVGFPAATFAW